MNQESSPPRVVQACLQADIPAGPVWDLQQAHAQAARQDRGLVARADKAGDARAWPFVLQPAVFAGGAARTAPAADPALGQHTDAVLQELGVAPADVQALRAEGVL